MVATTTPPHSTLPTAAPDFDAPTTIPPLLHLLQFLTTGPIPDGVTSALLTGPLDTYRPIAVYLHVPEMSTGALNELAHSGAQHLDVPALPVISHSTPSPMQHAYHTMSQAYEPLATLTEHEEFAALTPISAQALTAEVVALAVVYQSEPIATLTMITPTPLPKTWSTHVHLEATVNALAIWLHGAAPTWATPESTENDHPASPALTDRHKAILDLLRDGLTNEQIANELAFSTSTIKQDIAALAEMLHATNRTELVIRADLAGL